jgi:hypothetical protein
VRGVRNAALFSTGLVAADASANAGAAPALAALLVDARALYAAHSALLSPPPAAGFLAAESTLLTGAALRLTTMQLGSGASASPTR